MKHNLSIIIGCFFFLATTQAQTLIKQEKEQRVEITTTYGNIIIKLYNKTPKHRDNFIQLVKAGYYDSLLFHRAIPEFVIQTGDPNSRKSNPGDKLGDTDLDYKIPPEFVPEYYHKRGAIAAARTPDSDYSSSAGQFYIVSGKRWSTKELTKVMNEYNYAGKMTLFSVIMATDSVKEKFRDYNFRGDSAGMVQYSLKLKEQVDLLFRPYQMDFTTQMIQQYIKPGGVPHLDKQYTVFGEVVSGMEVVDFIANLPRDENDRPLRNVRIKMRLLP
ncbi:MAG: peptidylprolyl isomerase [Bacteroidota bacterium]|jgi:cyclophilin family peptidyl-prolyl cis-trans isomerase|nr:peptidylprolyl isomerase [Sphingobacteriales bacterium]